MHGCQRRDKGVARQEIVHSYVPIKAGRSRAELQDSMARAWDFTCTCLRCQRYYPFLSAWAT